MLVLERIHTDLAQWGKTLDEFEDRTIFQTPAWVSFIAETQNAEPVLAVLKEGAKRLVIFLA